MPEPNTPNTPGTRDYYRNLARSFATQAGIDPDIFEAQINQESGFQTSLESSGGAQGIAQIIPRWHPGVDPWNPEEALDYSASLMAGHLNNYGGDIRKALTAYHAGPGTLNRAIELGGANWEGSMLAAANEFFSADAARSVASANQSYLSNILGRGPAAPIRTSVPSVIGGLLEGREIATGRTNRDFRQRLQIVQNTVFGRPADGIPDEPFPGYTDILSPFQRQYTNLLSQQEVLGQQIDTLTRNPPTLGSAVTEVEPSIPGRILGFLADRVFPIGLPSPFVPPELREGQEQQREVYNQQLEALRLEYDALLVQQTDLTNLFTIVNSQVIALSDRDPAARADAQALVDQRLAELPDSQRSVIQSLLGEVRGSIEEFVDTLSVMTEEEAQALSQTDITELLFRQPRARPVASYLLTTDQLRISLKGFRPTGPSEEMTGEQIRQILMAQGLDDPELDAYRSDTSARVKELLDSSREIEQNIAAMRSGEGDWMLPKPGVADYLKIMAIQPMLVATQALEKYYHGVVQPIVGSVAYGLSVGILPGEQQFERRMDEALKDNNFWLAAGEAWRSTDVNPVARFAIETVFDPTTYIGWGIAPRLLKPIPFVGRRLSAMTSVAEHAYLQAASAPFRLAGAGISKIPKPTATLALLERGRITGLVTRYAAKSNPLTKPTRVTASQTTEALSKALEIEARFPEFLADEGVQIARTLKALPTPDTETVMAWVGRTGGTLTADALTSSKNLLLDIDTLITRAIDNPKDIGIISRQLMPVLGIEDSTKSFQAVESLVKSVVDDSSRQAKRLINGESQFAITTQIADHAADLVRRNRESASALLAKQRGILSFPLSRLPEGAAALWSGTAEKFLIKPLARSYLLFGFYNLWNVAETRLKILFAGKSPFGRSYPQMHFDALADSVGGRPEVLMGKGSALMLGDTVDSIQAASKGIEKFLVPDFVRRLFRESLATKSQAYSQSSFLYQLTVDELKRLRPKEWGAIQTALDEVGMDFKFLPRSLRPWAQDATTAAILRGPQAIRDLPKDITTETLRAFNTQRMLSKYDLIDDAAQQYVVSQAENGRLFTATDEVIRELTDLTWERHIRSPEFFANNFESMVDEVLSAPINTEEDFFKRLITLQGMSRGYGDVLSHQYRVAREASEKVIKAIDNDRIWEMWRRASNEFGTRATDSIDRHVEALRRHLSVTGERSADVDLLMNRYIALKDLDAAAYAWRRNIAEELFTHEAPAGSHLRRSNEWWAKAKDQMARPFREAEESRRAMLREILTLERKIGQQPRFPVPDASGRTLSRADLAVAYNIRMDDVNTMTFLTDLQAMMGKDDFIDDVTHRVLYNLEPGQDPAALGWTEDRIGDIWDDIMRELRLNPENVSSIAPAILQVEDMRRELLTTALESQIPEESSRAFSRWADDLSGKLGQVEGYATPEGTTTQGWLEGKGQALQNSTDEFFQTFPDYIDLNYVDTLFRSQFPFWTYEFHRLFYLPRQFMRTPGLITGLGRYNEATGGDNYTHVPFTSLEINPLRGTILMGGLRRLLIRDYPEYYDVFPKAQQTLDYIGRFGFYPGAHITGLNVLFGTVLPGQSQFGELVPVWMKAPVQGFQAFANLTGNEIMQEASKRLADVFIPERYRDYMIALKVSELGALDEETGVVISGADLLNKRVLDTPLTEAEQDLWDRATGEMSSTFILMDQTSLFRFRPEEMNRAREELDIIAMEYTGLSKEQLEGMRAFGTRWQDIFPPTPEVRDLLNATEALTRWSGFTTALFGASEQQFRARRSEFWDEIDTLRLDIKAEHETLDCQFGFAGATGCDHPGSISAREWISQDSALGGTYGDRFDGLKGQDRYKDIPVTREDIVEFYQRTGQPLPVEHPLVELLRLYYDIQLDEKFDEQLGTLAPDYFTFYAEREILLQAAGDQREELEARIERYDTELGKLHRWSYTNYLKPYYNRRELTISRLSPEAQPIIRRWLSSDNPLERDVLERIEIDGRTVVGRYNQDMRVSSRRFRFFSPDVDAWLAFWQVTDSFVTDEGQRRYVDLLRRYRPNEIAIPPVQSGVAEEGS